MVTGLSANIHPKLVDTIETLLITPKCRWYAHFGMYLNYRSTKDLPTCAVTVEGINLIFLYNPEFLEKLTQKEVNFVYLHELWHLFSNHLERGWEQGLDMMILNVAADAIINETIAATNKEHSAGIPDDFAVMPDGLVRMPAAYTGAWQMEPLYEYFLQNPPKMPKGANGEGEGEGEGGGTGSGKLQPGETLDSHIKSENAEAAKQIANKVKEIIDGIKARGDMPGDMEKMIEKLSKPKINILRHIRKVVANIKGASNDLRTIRKPHRKGFYGVKGKIDQGQAVTVVLDTSGSMWGEFQKVLTLINKDGLMINLVQVDTRVHEPDLITSRKQIGQIKIKGGGGTLIQPGVDYAIKNYPNNPVIVLTDGYTDTLHFGKSKMKALVVTTGCSPTVTGRVTVINTNGQSL